jgi:hypothetical protein
MTVAAQMALTLTAEPRRLPREVLGGVLGARVEGLLACVEVAEEEIAAANLPSGLRERAFGALCQTAPLRGKSPDLYRAHARELLQRLRRGEPLALGTHEEFIREWCILGTRQEGHKVRDPKALGIYLREQSIMLRRTRKDVGRELPPVITIPHLVDADQEPLAAIEGAAAELARIILTQGGQKRGEKLKAAEELSWRLRQATGIAKAPHVAALVRMLVEQGEQVLLTGWHREVYSIWLERLVDLNPVMFTGSESASAKARSVEAFVKGDAKVLVMSLRAGAGLEGLQEVCHVVVNGELDWSPKVHSQVAGRLHRDGQDEPVLAYFPYTDSGSDPTVLGVLGVKNAQSEGIVNPYHAIVEPLDVAGGEQNIRQLAEAYLRQRGLELPAPRGEEDAAA